MIDTEMKIQIVSMRLEGYSIRKIAETVGKYHQTIHVYLSGLTQNVDADQSPRMLPTMLSEADRTSLATAIVNGKGDVEKTLELAAKLECETMVIPAMAFMKARATTRASSEYYPKIQEWRRQNGVSIEDFRRRLGVGPSTVTLMLNRRTQLRLSRARKLKEITGLSLRDIYEDDIAEIDMEINRQKRAEAKARNKASGHFTQSPGRIMTVDRYGEEIVFPPTKKKER